MSTQCHLAETGRNRCRGSIRGRFGALERANRRDSRRQRSFSFESIGSSGYDRDLLCDKWEMSTDMV